MTRAVLVHGASADGATWASFAERLAARGWEVEAPDVVGAELRAMADSLLAQVKPEPDLALGHSLGGAVLLEALERLRPRRAIYADPAWRFELAPERVAAGRRFLDTAGREQWRQFLPGLGDRDLDAFRAASARWDRAGPERVDVVPSGPPPVPSLLMLSAEPAFDPPPGYQVARLHGVGHFMFWLDPQQCLRVIDEFLAG
ncbi:MAG TPA: alpha/beta hydrolase [Candidatus Dormibacteraeota bacterium]